MSIHPSRWSRRAILRGLGASLALPVMAPGVWAPGAARAATATSPKRLIVWFMPNGFVQDVFRPSSLGVVDGALPSTLTALAPWSDRLTWVSGFENLAPNGHSDPHRCALGGVLTGHLLDPNAAAVANGISFDQVLAQAWKGQTRFGSLELSSEAEAACSLLADPDGGVGIEALCAYTSHLSWDGPGRPRPATVDPQAVFDRLFGAADAVGDAEATARRVALRGSLLDSVMADATRFHATLGQHDAQRVEQFLDTMRDVERSLASRSECSLAPEDATEAWTPTDIQQHVDQMHRLMTLALSCDETRVITYRLGRAASNRPYPHLGFHDAHHLVSHHQGSVTKLTRLKAIERWAMDQLANLVSSLEATPNATGGTLLDDTLILVAPELAESASHLVHDLTFLLIGDLQGTLRTGVHLSASSDGRRPHSELLRGLLHAFGEPDDTFAPTGDGAYTDMLA